MHYLYILKSAVSGKFYVGETNNLDRRLNDHSEQRTAFGKRNAEIKIVFKKTYENRSKARKAELWIKKKKSHSFIEKLIQGNRIIPLSRM